MDDITNDSDFYSKHNAEEIERQMNEELARLKADERAKNGIVDEQENPIFPNQKTVNSNDKNHKLLELINSKRSGEQIMKELGIKRKNDLESLAYNLSIRENKLIMLNWEASSGKHALPELKVASTGLTLSNERLRRSLGHDVAKGTKVTINAVSNNEISLKFN